MDNEQLPTFVSLPNCAAQVTAQKGRAIKCRGYDCEGYGHLWSLPGGAIGRSGVSVGIEEGIYERQCALQIAAQFACSVWNSADLVI